MSKLIKQQLAEANSTIEQLVMDTIHDFYSRKPMTLVMGGMRPKKIN
jgi:hypothetical protein